MTAVASLRKNIAQLQFSEADQKKVPGNRSACDGDPRPSWLKPNRCRLSIPQATRADADSYAVQAQNRLADSAPLVTANRRY